ncbi:MAG: tRNA pseudouridine synthase A [Solirubrobacteraceae bacterium]|nr:MAG: tRNA pseudouridine(38-40) synthase TruA [Solirubrobacterales bacterium]
MAVSRLLIEYDGGAFHGWARQPGWRTVQIALEDALGVVLREPVTLSVAGRTDRGVHAWGQVASYVGPAARVASLNALLPRDVAVLACEAGPEGFDARRDALSRTYCYRVLGRPARSAIEAGRALWWPHALDFAALCECADALRGIHDFSAFTPSESHHTHFHRHVLDARWERAGAPGAQLLEFWIGADSFMRTMNRVLVGTMLEVAGGRRAVSDFVALLNGAPRSAAGATAPAHGLALAGVRYGPEIGW